MATRPTKFTRSISMSNMDKRDKVKQMLHGSVKLYDAFKWHYVEADMSTRHNYCVNFGVLDDELREMVEKNLVDFNMLDHLEETKALNFFRQTNRLYPIITPGDGNCLMHAASLTMWSMIDRSTLLRRLVYVALATEEAERGPFFRRWISRQKRIDKEEGAIHLTDQDIKTMWNEIKESASDIRNVSDQNNLPYKCLEHIHVFVLCNILRRPIIIISDTNVHYPSGSVHESANTFDGIYLPLLWSHNQCYKYPLVLGYGNSHFVPLLGMDLRMATNESKLDVVPLVKYNLAQRAVHFLLKDEEPRSNYILSEYLSLKEVPDDHGNQLLCAELKYNPLDDGENLLWDFFQELEKKYRRNSELPSPMETEENDENEGDKINLGLSENPPPPRMDGRGRLSRVSSFIHETCNFPECYNRVSGTNSPYCYLHTTTELMESDAICPAEGCKFLADPKYDGFCVVHKPPKPCACLGTVCDQSKCFPNGMCAECFVTEPLICPEPECTTKGCKKRGTPKHNMLCSTCILNHGFDSEDLAILANLLVDPESEKGNAVPLYKCREHDCFAAATASALGHCNKHFLLKYKHDKIDIPTQRQVDEFKRRMQAKAEKRKGKALKLDVSARSRHPSGHVRQEKKLCATPGCAGVRCKKDDLCYHCLISTKLGHEPEPVVFTNYNLSSDSDDDDTESGEEGGDIIESGSPSPANTPKPPKPQRKRSWKDKCIAPGCSNKADKRCNGLCMTCYKVLERENMQKVVLESPEISIKDQTGKGKSKPTQLSEMRTKCKSSTCRMYGTKEQKGYCSSCYGKLQKGLIMSSESRKALQKHFGTLVSDMQPDEVLDSLFSAQIFSYQQMEEARCLRTSSDKARYIVEQLQHRAGEHGFSAFVQALNDTNQPHLARLLRNERDPSRQDPYSHHKTHKRPDQAPVASPCRSRSCDRYGDPAFNGFCSLCNKKYGRHESKPYSGTGPGGGAAMGGPYGENQGQALSLIAPSGSSFEENYNQIVRTVAPVRQKCKFRGCDHFGNPQNNGYCNAGHIQCDA